MIKTVDFSFKIFEYLILEIYKNLICMDELDRIHTCTYENMYGGF